MAKLVHGDVLQGTISIDTDNTHNMATGSLAQVTLWFLAHYPPRLPSSCAVP